MGFLDTTDAEMISLAYERRRGELLAVHMAEPMDLAKVQRAYQRLHGHPLPTEPVRFSARGDEFTPSISVVPLSSRRKGASKAWRRAQWASGNRNCYYCSLKMEPIPKNQDLGPLCVTVDHKEPLVAGGDDAPWNWALGCWLCNNRKGQMSEAEFRALLDAEKHPPAWVDGGRLTA